MAKVGIISDTHDQIARTGVAVGILQHHGAELIIHCGDLACPEILAICEPLPTWFVFGNHDADSASLLKQMAPDFGATCLGWGGEFSVDEKRIAVVHGHLTSDLRPLLESKPNYLLSGHSHRSDDWMHGEVRRINPGALHRASEFTVATLDTACGEVEFLPVPR
ncbi:metallophosphatase family protein [bacterium]|nr:metallophosphatase family protein [bacterium]